MATQGRPLSPEFKRALVLVKDYFDRTKGDLREQECSSAERTANALGVGLATVKRVMADSKRSPAWLIQDESRRRGRPPRVISDALQTMTRAYVRQANREGSHLTLEMLSEYLKEEGGDPNFSIRTLGRALDRWGFTFGKGTRSQHLKEKDHVVAARHRYLREKRANRKGADVIRPEVYLDESYVNKNHSNDFIWYWDEDGPWVQKPSGKGERLIIIHAMTKDGWIPNAKLVVKSTKKTGDYHGQMNHDLFMKWFGEHLLPNIPNNALIVMDNAPYHNALSEHSAPTANCKKDEIRSWLYKNRIPVRDDCLKAELVEILDKVAPAPTYAIDELARAQGHEILRTPPYHPELQPIETCWAVVKNQIASKIGQEIYADFEEQNMEAFVRMEESGKVTILPFPQDVIQRLSEKTYEILENKSKEDETFARIYKSYKTFQNKHTRWSKNAYAFENWKTCGYLKNYQILELKTSFESSGIGEVLQSRDEQLRDKLIISLKGDIVFDFGSSTIKPHLTKKVKHIADILLPFPSASILVEGYTDKQGRPDYNIRLSRNRSDAVKKLLSDEGFEGKIEAVGKGETDKFGQRDEENRRAEVTITHSTICN